jgi:8-oxo-dGTP pyrophosphatase MutT (NUDIX family)
VVTTAAVPDVSSPEEHPTATTIVTTTVPATRARDRRVTIPPLSHDSATEPPHQRGRNRDRSAEGEGDRLIGEAWRRCDDPTPPKPQIRCEHEGTTMQIEDAAARLLDEQLARRDVDDPVHVTGSAIVVGERGTVLLEHRRLGMWLQPGGHIDPGEDPWDAARREAAEETGLDVVFHDGRVELVHVDVHAGGRGHTHLDLRYLLDGGSADPDPPAGESQAVAWFAWPTAVERAGDPRLAGLLGVLGRRFG